MENTHVLFETIAVTLLAGIFAQVVAEKFRMPSIIFLMLFGVFLGPEFANLIQPHALGEGLEVMVSLAVALILFEGGLSLDLQAFTEVNQSVRNLLTIGMGITVIGATLLTHYILGIGWALSVLFGSIVSITGLTVVDPILRRVRIKRSIVTILRGEGILADAFGVFLSVTVLEAVLSANTSVTFFAQNYFIKLFVGLIIGAVTGWMLGILLEKKYIGDDLKNLVVLAWVVGVYYLTELWVHDTGVLSVAMAGFIVQQKQIPQLDKLKKFKGQLSILFISILFILISANLDLGLLTQVGWKGLFVVALVVFVLRPLAVFASNIGLLELKEKIFLSWIGPKGIVSASIASLFVIILNKNGYENASVIESLVFLTIMLTVTLQGLTARRAAKICDCLMEQGTVIIVGANAIGKTLATAFNEIGQETVLIDNNALHCYNSSSENLNIIHGNCLDPAILEAAEIYKAGMLIATTANSEVNFLACQMAKDEYKVSKVYPAIDSPDKGVQQKLVEQIGGDLAFAKPANVSDWKEAVDHNQVKIFEWALEGSGGKLEDLQSPDYPVDDWLPLIIKREAKYHFAHSAMQWSEGDIVVALVKS